MNIVCLSSDLMMTGKISSLARTKNIPCAIVGSVEKLASATESMDSNMLWLVDLQRCGNDFESIVAFAAPHLDRVALVGYAQHVHPELLDSAKAAGFIKVLTRGQFDRQIPAIIEEFSQPAI